MTSPLIGKLVNGYEILSQIGQGGMATVFLARQQSMNRNVALKFLPNAYLNDELYLQRFEREVKIVSQLEHRNIVPVYDFGEFDGQPYIAMRYMPAGSVEELLAAGKVPLRRVLNIVEQVASALDYAHQKGILHRDLKPSNILLDDGGGVFITDFGIARILSESGGNITTQGVVGTPSYMSPEQAQGEPLDGRSDVYSLGVMLFELVTGRRPFESDTPYSIAVLHVTAPPPSPRDYDPSVSLPVEQVIMRALRKAPGERFASAGEMAVDLRRAIESGPKSAEHGVSKEAPARTPGRATQPAIPTPDGLPAAPGYAPGDGRSRSLARRLVSLFRRRMWLGMAAGSALGCGLLLALLALGVSLLGILSRDDALSPPTQAPAIGPLVTAAASATGLPTAAVSAIEASDPFQATLVELNAAADATYTAAAQISPSQPTLTPAIQPVGLREPPALNPALQAATGELVFFAPVAGDTGNEPRFEIVTLNLGNGDSRRFDAGGGSSTYPLASPDGRWIAFQSNRDGDFDIYVANRRGGQLRQLTRNNVLDRLAAWSPDGNWIIYSTDSRGDGAFDLYRARLDGTASQPVYSDGWRNSHARYSPDGDSLVFTAGRALRDARSWELRLLSLPSGQSRLLTNNEVRDASPVFSPDGQRILYVTTIDGARSLASMNLVGEEQAVLPTGPGNVWAASYSLDGRFIVVTATVAGTDQLFLMQADGANIQQITRAGGAYASWIPPIR